MIKPDWQSDDGAAVLYCGDCLSLLPEIRADAVVTDPPYGIGKRLTSGGKRTGGWHRMVASGADEWDVRPSKEVFDLIFKASKEQIIWGGNFFDLPSCQKPLCWDKVRPNQKNASEWEYAWTSMVGRAQMFRHCANGGFILKTPRVHPTQKPLPLMEWCLSFLPSAETILDPYMGSGTTGVACIKTGRRFIGIELNRDYFNIAVNRIEQAIREKSQQLTFV